MPGLSSLPSVRPLPPPPSRPLRAETRPLGRTRRNSWPTAPVIPAIATVGPLSVRARQRIEARGAARRAVGAAARIGAGATERWEHSEACIAEIAERGDGQTISTTKKRDSRGERHEVLAKHPTPAPLPQAPAGRTRGTRARPAVGAARESRRGAARRALPPPRARVRAAEQSDSASPHRHRCNAQMGRRTHHTPIGCARCRREGTQLAARLPKRVGSERGSTADGRRQITTRRSQESGGRRRGTGNAAPSECPRPWSIVPALFLVYSCPPLSTLQEPRALARARRDLGAGGEEKKS